jgi:hypothetical protein
VFPPKLDHRGAQPRMALHQAQVAGLVGAALRAHDGFDRGLIGGAPIFGDPP